MPLWMRHTLVTRHMQAPRGVLRGWAPGPNSHHPPWPGAAPSYATKHFVTLDKYVNLPDCHRRSLGQVISRVLPGLCTETPSCQMNLTFQTQLYTLGYKKQPQRNCKWSTWLLQPTLVTRVWLSTWANMTGPLPHISVEGHPDHFTTNSRSTINAHL